MFSYLELGALIWSWGLLFGAVDSYSELGDSYLELGTLIWSWGLSFGAGDSYLELGTLTWNLRLLLGTWDSYLELGTLIYSWGLLFGDCDKGYDIKISFVRMRRYLLILQTIIIVGQNHKKSSHSNKKYALVAALLITFEISDFFHRLLKFVLQLMTFREVTFHRSYLNFFHRNSRAVWSTLALVPAQAYANKETNREKQK